MQYTIPFNLSNGNNYRNEMRTGDVWLPLHYVVCCTFNISHPQPKVIEYSSWTSITRYGVYAPVPGLRHVGVHTARPSYKLSRQLTI